MQNSTRLQPLELAGPSPSAAPVSKETSTVHFPSTVPPLPTPVHSTFVFRPSSPSTASTSSWMAAGKARKPWLDGHFILTWGHPAGGRGWVALLSTPDRLLLPPPLLQQRCNHVVSWIREPILLKISHHCKHKHERCPKGKRNRWEQGWGRGWVAQPPSAAARTSAKWYMVMIQPWPQMKFQSYKPTSNPLWSALSAKVLQCLKTPWSKRNKWLPDSQAADWWASSVFHPCLLLPQETQRFLLQFSWKLHWCFNSRGSRHGQVKSMAWWCTNVAALFHHVLLNQLLPPPLPSAQCLSCSHHCTGPRRFLITIVWERWDTHFSVAVKY